MNIFQQIMSKLKRAAKPAGEFNALDHCLSVAGVDPNNVRPGPSGIPLSVLMGCKKEIVVIPNTSHPARRKDGSIITQKNKRGREMPVMQSYGIDRKIWKSMMNDQKRKAEGRWYSGEPADVREKRLARRAA